MQLNRKKIWIPLVVLVVVAAAVVGLVFKHSADNHSRAKARTAAAAYEKAAHTYLAAAASDLTAIGSPKTNAVQATAGLEGLEKLQKSVPHLVRVDGAGAKLPAYQKAAAYQAKVQKVTAAIQANDAADEIYLPYEQTYAALVAVQNDINAGKLSEGDPATAVANVIVTPLVAAQAKFQKAATPSKYAAMAGHITALLNDYIDAGNTLETMYKTGNLHSVNFNFLPQLNVAFSDFQTAAAPLNAQALQAAAQAQALAKQS